MVSGAPGGGAALGAHVDGGINDDTMIEDAIEVCEVIHHPCIHILPYDH